MKLKLQIYLISLQMIFQYASKSVCIVLFSPATLLRKNLFQTIETTN